MAYFKILKIKIKILSKYEEQISKILIATQPLKVRAILKLEKIH